MSNCAFLSPCSARLKISTGSCMRLLSTRKSIFLSPNPIISKESFDTKYFSYEKHDQIQGAKFSGMLGYKIDMFKLFKSSKINLNITYRMITKGISLRALDIMAAGGFLLSNWQEELVEYFEPGVDFVYYDSLEDAYNKAKYYLTHEDERKEIAQNGHKAVKRFDYQIQLKRVFEEVFE